MIQFFYENLPETVNTDYKTWLESIILSEGKKLGEINYIFCDDEYLLKVNQDYLQHDYYTDIITFDYVKGKTISGEIFVSLQRISENASTLAKEYEEELRRVLAHGILHLSGYKDKTQEEEKLMRSKEDFYLAIYRATNS
ncbi:MAG: rRNA maturation RNase YbeY [Chryseobacterium taeanense]|jgi:rRNA maturation RNase YbeY